jgi:hypothetical protein
MICNGARPWGHYKWDVCHGPVGFGPPKIEMSFGTGHGHLSKWVLAGHTQGSTLQQRTNKTLTTGPFGNTCEADEVSPEVEVGVVAGLQCMQP